MLFHRLNSRELQEGEGLLSGITYSKEWPMLGYQRGSWMSGIEYHAYAGGILASNHLEASQVYSYLFSSIVEARIHGRLVIQDICK